jgi:hypothetical protein
VRDSEPVTEQVRHDERLRAPWTWWLLVAGFGISVWWSFALATPVWFATAVGALTSVALSVLLWRYGNARVAVLEGRLGPELVAGRAHVPVALCGKPRPLDAEQLRRVLGPEADARSYVLVRPYSRGGVLVPLEDPADPTPSWVVASNRPEALAGALRAARAPLAD